MLFSLNTMIEFLAIVLFAALLWLIPPYYQRLRRYYLRSRPLSSEQLQLLAQWLPLYRYLPAEQKRELQGNMALFLHEKAFVGCEGLLVTEAMRVAVAAHACLLLLGSENRCYPDLYTVLLYPTTYVAREIHREGYIETTAHSVREGEAHYRGPVVLSWGDLEDDILHPENGRNVALHEFAHKIDEEDGAYDGRPLRVENGRRWSEVFGDEFEKLRRRLKHEETIADQQGAAPVLDLYGAESPAEFFAVATEAFFVIPHEMRAAHPQLYRELSSFYRVDPAALLPSHGFNTSV
ncbi:M90 family metallopeptidase [Microbulbifer thermotolerans]|uniref:M90 family metallopeptidase n=1 Tax=Microbulbifer thermotolerans TaxID=252514 RepID=UPI00224B99BF|nr:M90 family metallopeptidase [Microbulbifer thermotolerans]